MYEEPKKKEEINLDEISHNISEISVDQRKTIFEHLALVKDEKWASEALEIDQPFSPEELEFLLSLISDPYLSFEVLTLDETTGKKLSRAQAERLMTQLETDRDVAESFYLQLVESGVAEEPTDTEKWWLERLRKLLDITP
jgi:hypothetical protein